MEIGRWQFIEPSFFIFINDYMRKQHTTVRYQLTCFFLFCVVLYLACKKSEQTIPATTVPVTKNFFELPKNIDPVVSGIINALNRENEKIPFAEAMVKNAGCPQWEYAIKKSSTSFREEITDQVINVPLVKSGDKKTSAVLTVNISNNDTTYGLAYPQQYILYNLDDSSGRQLLFARDFFNVFASFDHALFGTTQYFVNDGRIFGFERNDTLLVTVRYGENQGERQQPGAVAGPNTAGVTVCTTTTSCVYAGSPSPLRANEFVVPGTTSTGKCTITSSCISIITGGGDGGSTAPTSPTSTSETTTGGGSTSTTNTTTTATPGSTNTSIPTLTSTPCVRIANNNARLPVTDPCGSQPWTSIPKDNSFADIEHPIDAPDEPVINNGIIVTDIPDGAPTGIPRLIGRTTNRGNTEDMLSGTNGDVTGIIPGMVSRTDDQLFSDMYWLFYYCTYFDNELRSVGDLMRQKFKDKTGGTFENAILNKKVNEDNGMSNFLKDLGNKLAENLTSVKGDINQISIIEMPIRPKFNTFYNKFHGLQVLINDTEYTEIELENFNLDPTGAWYADVLVTVHDHFGLDKHDALTYQDQHLGFAAWWLLQHTRGYRPFETIIHVKKRILGTL